MSAQRILAAVALLAGTSSFAATINGGVVATPNPVNEYLTGLHALDGNVFIDTYDFAVTGAGLAAAAVSEGAFTLSGGFGSAPFTFSALVLADASNNALSGANAIDVDGSDGWLVFAALPTAGTYRVLLQGVSPLSANDPAETQFYLGLLTTQVNAVPEPGTYGLLGLSLLAAVATRRRR